MLFILCCGWQAMPVRHDVACVLILITGASGAETPSERTHYFQLFSSLRYWIILAAIVVCSYRTVSNIISKTLCFISVP